MYYYIYNCTVSFFAFTLAVAVEPKWLP